jgi:TolB-like protein
VRRLLPVLLLLLILPSAQGAETARIAVLDFTNASLDPDLAPLGKGLQSMLTTDLAQVSAFSLVERQRLKDITAELELGASEFVDASTAARIGRLAGASHLLVGSFTVVGDTMRLDARLVAVEDGGVVLAERIEGEVAAFFELEQTLVQALVRALEVDLAPKERAGIRRIHTADFEAFRAFSRGIDRFDAEAYDDALVALRDAAERDEDFKLARVTLKQYEEIITRLRARSASLQTARKELERLEKAKEASDQAEMLARLWSIAEGSAEADAQGTAQDRRRPAALYMLSVAYGNVGRNRGKLSRLRQTEDRFAMERSADALHRAFFEEAGPRWPELPLVVTDRFWRGLPEVASEDGGPPKKPFHTRFAELATHLFEKGADHPENRRKYLLDDLRYPSNMARRLHLDRAEEAELLEAFFDRAQALSPPDYWVDDFEEKLADAYRGVLRLDDATRLLTKKAGALENPGAIEGVARQIEVNRDYQRVLDRARNKALVREWLLLAQDGGWSRGPIVRFAEEQFSGAVPTAKGLRRLADFRKFPSRDDAYLLLGRHPAWVIQGRWLLRTGPRVDPLRAGSIRYYTADVDQLEPMVLLDGVPTADLQARFTLTFDPADDWWPPKVRPEGDALPAGSVHEGRPGLRFLFGVEDVAVDKRKDPDTDEYFLPRPTTLWAVHFEGGRVALSRGIETRRGSYGRKEAFDWKETASASLPLAGASVAVEIVVRGHSVRVRAGTKRVVLKLPVDPPSGFYGLMFDSLGYLEVADLRLER